MEDYQFRPRCTITDFFPSLHNKTWHLIPSKQKKREDKERIHRDSGKAPTGLANLSAAIHMGLLLSGLKLISMKRKTAAVIQQTGKNAPSWSLVMFGRCQGLACSCQMSVIIISESAIRSVLSDSLHFHFREYD